MALPGLSDPLDAPELREKAEKESERLLEELKKSVKAQVSDVGVLRKGLTVTVPAKIIADHLDHNYDEIMHDVVVPGFRKGRAPRRLVEKRFGAEVRESLTTTIVGQSFFAAVENEKLDVLGDPLFQIPTDGGVKLVDLDEAMAHLKLPEAEDFSYTCEVEVKPEFALPELKGIEIKSPELPVTDEMVDAELLRQRKLRGRYEPLPDAAAEKDDMLVADVALSVADKEVKREENVQLGVRPCRLDGIPLPKLAEALVGIKPGETRTVDCSVPDDYERTDLRGQTGRFEFKVHELKRLTPMSLADYLQHAGFDNEEEGRTFLRQAIEGERNDLIERAKKDQIAAYLIEKTVLDLPEQLSARQTERAVARRMIELRQRGVPDGDLEAHADELRTSAKEEAVRDLKLGFILGKVAEQLEVDITDEEVNSEIAQMARRYQRRFDRVRDDLQKQGLLSQLAEQIRQDKCIVRLLADAKVVEVKAEDEPEKPKSKKQKKTE